MAVNNSIKKQGQTAQSGVTEYDSNGEKVKLSPAIIRRYLVSGGGNASDEEVMMFLSMCKFQHLNPFLREAYLIKYGESQPATMVVGKDVFLKRARRQNDFQGHQAGIIVQAEDGALIEREGTFYLRDREILVGGWAKVYVRGYSHPNYASVALDEYIGKKKNGEVNGQWAGKTATMIRKVALAQALKEAFPDYTAGLYEQEEVTEAAAIALDEAPVLNVEDKPLEATKPAQAHALEAAPQAVPQPSGGEQSVMAALFGRESE